MLQTDKDRGRREQEGKQGNELSGVRVVGGGFTTSDPMLTTN